VRYYVIAPHLCKTLDVVFLFRFSTDVQKVTFYGSRRNTNSLDALDDQRTAQSITRYTQSDAGWPDSALEEEGPELEDNDVEEGYRQLTSISKYSLLASANMKELRIDGNRIKVWREREHISTEGGRLREGEEGGLGREATDAGQNVMSRER